jgi:putative two-component system response regulator
LSPVEFTLVQTHPEAGYNILKGIEFPWPILDAIYQHHERINGSGYPKGLSKADIIPEALILAVADVVEAMASHRPYRPALGIDAALKEIEINKGILYDEDAVNACINLFRNKGFKLPDGWK